MSASRKKILVLDFDGVICDSTPECLVTSLHAWQIYAEENTKGNFGVSQDDSGFVDFFYRVRPYVRGGGEYLLVYLLWFEGNLSASRHDFADKSSSFVAEQSRFAEIFYECREIFIRQDVSYWCDLHKPVDGVQELISMISEPHQWYIATLKDKNSVSRLLEHYDISFSPEYILDREDIENKLEALNCIRLRESVSEDDIYFVDDNPMHLLPIAPYFKNIYLSTWVGCDESTLIFAQSNGLKTLNSWSELTDLINF